MKKAVHTCVLVLIWQMVAVPVMAQTTPIGQDFQINVATTDYQRDAHVAADEAGNYVVVWADDFRDVFVRQVFSDGTAGDEMLLESAWQPSVARAPAGEFVVAYIPEDSSATLAQIFDPSGSPIGGAIQASENDGLSVGRPNVDTDADGNFVVVWNTFSKSGRDLWARRLGFDGLPLGEAIQVDGGNPGTHADASVAVADDGQFAVVWTGSQSSGDDDDLSSVQGRIYASDGQALGAPFQVNTLTTFRQEQPDIAALSDGSWVVVWTDDSGQEPLKGIAMQRLGSAGQFLGSQVAVNSYTTGNQIIPSVAAYDEGGFVVTWESFGSTGDDSLLFSVQGQVFDGQGLFLGEQFQVNSYTPTSQMRVEVATAPGQRAMMVWTSLASTGDDDSFSSIQGRRFGPFMPSIFTDGFESGNTASWSDAQP